LQRLPAGARAGSNIPWLNLRGLMMRRVLHILLVPSLVAVLSNAAVAQAPPGPIPGDDPRARLTTGLVELLLAGDSAAAAAYVRSHAAPTADMARLLTGLARIAAEAAGVPGLAIARTVGVPDGPGGVELSDGLVVMLTTAGDPPRIVNMLLGRMRPDGERGPQGARFASLPALEQHVGQAVAAAEFSGVVLAARGEDVLFHRAFGLANREDGVPVRPDTRFNLGSINKALTTVAILRLAQEGRLRLDDPVGTHVRGLSDEIARKVTIRHLLQHRGGVGDYLSDPQFAASPARFRTVDALLGLMRDRPLDFEPGSGQRYSNSGYVLLGAVIESLTGRAYHDVIDEWVLKPSGMTSTSPDGEVPNTALGYTRGAPGSTAPLARSTFRPPGTPAGGGYSTATDLHRFLLALASDRLLDQQHTDVMVNGFDAATARGDRTGAYGIAGGAPGINAFAEVDLRTREVVVVLANLDPQAAVSLGASLVQRLPER
jgi:D-alanyl-D-alanine carboxypeptidase